MSTSITILPASLLLVHLPRESLRSLMFNVLDCMWWKPKEDSFFSLCENGLEVSLFADEATVRRAFAEYIPADFDDRTPDESDDCSSASDAEPECSLAGPSSPREEHNESGFTIVQSAEFTHPFDAERQVEQRSRDRKGKGKSAAHQSRRGSRDLREGELDRVKIGRNAWTVLEIEFHGDGWEEAGQRVRDISSPLAERGISILFLSTYTSDFILVPTAQLSAVTSVLTESGFNFSLDDDDESSPEASPGPGMRASFSSPLSPAFSSLGRTRASSSSTHGGSGSLSNSLVLSEHSTSSAGASAVLSRSESSARAHPPAPSPGLLSGPGGPLGGESRDALELLRDELVCVGLGRDSEAVWREKVVQALFFPDRILPELEVQEEVMVQEGRKSKTASPVMMRSMSLSRSNSATSRDFPLSRRSSSKDPRRSASRPPLKKLSSGSGSQQPTPRQQDASPARPPQPKAKEELQSTKPTPFIALTVTAYQASLTADIRLLRALFNEEEQETMVFAIGGGLSGLWQGEEEDDESSLEEDSDEDLAERVDSLGLSKGRRGRPRTRTGSEDSLFEKVGRGDSIDHDADAESGSRESARRVRREMAAQAGAGGRRLLKCLQLDLMGSLDRPGVVEAYAGLLIKGGVNLLYQSTFQSANILVSKAQSKLAKRILEKSWKERKHAKEVEEREEEREGAKE